MRRKIKSIFRKTKESIINFTASPISNLGFLIPIMIGLIAFISGVVTYIMFIKNGGYVTQVDIFKEYGLYDGVGQTFTTGTTGLIVTGVVGRIICGLVIVEFIIMMIKYFQKSGKAKKIIMVVDLVLLVIQTVITINIFGMAVIKFVNNEKAAYKYLESFGGIMSINPKAILITYEVITLILIITFLVLILITNDCSLMIGYTFKSLLFAIVAVPLVFLLLQNILPLAAGIVLVAITGIIIFVICGMIGGGGEGASSGSGSTSTGHSVSTRSSASAPKPVEKQPYQKEKKYDLNTAFWRDKGGYGIAVPQADCIYCKNAWGEKTYVCTVSDFEKGEVAIINKGSRVMNIAGCKSPAR